MDIYGSRKILYDQALAWSIDLDLTQGTSKKSKTVDMARVKTRTAMAF